MSTKAFMVGVTALVWGGAVPAAAQQERGTVEFGAFASAASFDKHLSLTQAYGAGGRVGIRLDRRWSLEFEKAEMRAGRPDGLKDVNVGILSSRLMFIPGTQRRTSFLAGIGAGTSTETNFLHSYGVDALVGLKMQFAPNAALRVDAVYDWLANEHWKTYRSVRVGLSIYRRPEASTRTAMAPAPTPTVNSRTDVIDQK